MVFLLMTSIIIITGLHSLKYAVLLNKDIAKVKCNIVQHKMVNLYLMNDDIFFKENIKKVNLQIHCIIPFVQDGSILDSQKEAEQWFKEYQIYSMDIFPVTFSEYIYKKYNQCVKEKTKHYPSYLLKFFKIF